MNVQPNGYAGRTAWIRFLLGGLVTIGGAAGVSAQAPLPRLQPGAELPLFIMPVSADSHGWVDPGWTPAVDSGHGASFWDTIKESVLGQHCGLEWRPMCGVFDGLCEPWVDPGPGTSGAPRKAWINTFDGFFTRRATLTYAFTDDLPGDRDFHRGSFSIETPLSRRLWLGIDVPFIDSLQGGRGPSTSHFGDMTITPKYMVYESRDFSLSTGLTVRVPTGADVTRDDRTTLLPFVAFWTDLGAGVSLRGGTGLDISLDHKRTADEVYVANVALGQTLTRHDAALLGDFTYYVSANLRQEFGENSSDHTFLTLTPGVRTNLPREWSFLAGYEFPIVGPKPFDDRVIFVLERDW
jgi:hypothetical protein